VFIITQFGLAVKNPTGLMGFDSRGFWSYNSGMVRTALTGDGRQGWATVLYVDNLWITF